MKIDRAGFLFLATALAAGGGCIITSGDDDSAGGGGDHSGGTGSGAGGTGGAATGGAATGGGDVGGAGGGTGGAGGGTVCDDSVGDAVDCAGADDSLCGAFAVTACDGVQTVFKPAVAEAAAQCIVDLGPADDCGAVYQCRSDALAGACPDSGADDLCVQILASCETSGYPVTAEECHGLVDGLNETGRGQVEICAVTDGCIYGLYSCTEGIGL
jgi:hypothetical protein